MQKTKIEWTDYTWNPIKGVCPVGCWYCYARRMYQRFGWDKKISMVGYMKLQKPRNIKKPSKIFVCSTIELFHPDVKIWTNQIFEVIEKCPQHTFQILTKFPQNIDRPMPDNVWLGVSVEKGNDEGWNRIYHLKEAKARIKFVSFEPLLGMLNSPLIINALNFDWFIFGRLTGFGKKYDPDNRWLIPIVTYFREYKKPVFLKDNLKEIWGEPLIQEFPDIKCQHIITVAINEEGHAGVYCSNCGEKLEDAC